MSHNEGRAQRINDVLVVGVKDEAIDDFACNIISENWLLTLEANDGLEFEILFVDLFHFLLLLLRFYLMMIACLENSFKNWVSNELMQRFAWFDAKLSETLCSGLR